MTQAPLGSDEHATLQQELRTRLHHEGGDKRANTPLVENNSSPEGRKFWASKDPTTHANTVGIGTREITTAKGHKIERRQALQLDNLISKKLSVDRDAGDGPHNALKSVLGDLELAGYHVDPETITPGVFYTSDKGEAYHLSPDQARDIRNGMREKAANRPLPKKAPDPAAAEKSGEVYKAAIAEGKTVAKKAREVAKVEPERREMAEDVKPEGELQAARDNTLSAREAPAKTLSTVGDVKLRPSPYEGNARKLGAATRVRMAESPAEYRRSLTKTLDRLSLKLDKHNKATERLAAHEDGTAPLSEEALAKLKLLSPEELSKAKRDFATTRRTLNELPQTPKERAVAIFKAGVEIGTAELTKEHEANPNSNPRRLAAELRRLNDPGSGLARKYAKDAAETDRFDQGNKTTETRADNETALDKTDLRVEVNEAVERAYRRMTGKEGSTGKVWKSEIKKAVENLNKKAKAGRLSGKEFDAERQFLAAARDAGHKVDLGERVPRADVGKRTVNGKEVRDISAEQLANRDTVANAKRPKSEERELVANRKMTQPGESADRVTRNLPENPLKNEEGRVVSSAKGVGEALRAQDATRPPGARALLKAEMKVKLAEKKFGPKSREAAMARREVANITEQNKAAKEAARGAKPIERAPAPKEDLSTAKPGERKVPTAEPLTAARNRDLTGRTITGPERTRAVIAEHLAYAERLRQSLVEKLKTATEATKEVIRDQIANVREAMRSLRKELESSKSLRDDGSLKDSTSDAVHEALGREGIPAAHVSPARHDGMFNWRKHFKSGDGRALNGAGTNLSSGDATNAFIRADFAARGNRKLEHAMAVRAKAVENVHLVRRLLEYAEKKGLAADVAKEQENLAHRERMAELADKDVKELTEAANPEKPPVYHVTVEAKPHEILDFDRPVSEQSDLVRAAFKKWGVDEKLSGEQGPM